MPTPSRKPITRKQLRLVLGLQLICLVGTLGLMSCCPIGGQLAMGLIVVAWVLSLGLFIDANGHGPFLADQSETR